MTDTFQLLPGEKVLHVVGMPGPDTNECEIISQDGEVVTIRFQVWGTGPVHEKTVPITDICWLRGSDTSQRYAEWKRHREEPTETGQITG